MYARTDSHTPLNPRLWLRIAIYKGVKGAMSIVLGIKDHKENLQFLKTILRAKRVLLIAITWCHSKEKISI